VVINHNILVNWRGLHISSCFAAICMIAGCVCFPAGWSEDSIRRVCGASDRYELGSCGIRWAYLLAAIGCLDAVILATLAFILATRHVRLQPDPHYAPASLFKGNKRFTIISSLCSAHIAVLLIAINIIIRL
jgi:hypothetical protein